MPRPAQPRLILASRSPRRAQLLREAGYTFERADPPFDDSADDHVEGMAPAELAEHLARLKAQSFLDHHPPHSVVLCADTLCVDPAGHFRGPVGKPTSRDDARTMIQRFANTDHDIVTAVALLDEQGHLTSFTDTATATFGSLSDAQIDEYLDTGDWSDKAGGYNLFDRQAAGWPIQVQGDPTTVVGLPMQRLNEVLPTLGITPQRNDE